ncbi:glycerophosphodiester phosphodiesterase family protein [Mesorhizobium xinjiangense]|uniref:glycerophosphodiester phosphodiesterase family protein n=1 Tax=Mesorhizobium xinjiangense TaxID=2678685 RepID=UPI0012ED5283|nr:glycerophosphodiester phosphodiesterase family protein [Mesorhizobium xinjiangense]
MHFIAVLAAFIVLSCGAANAGEVRRTAQILDRLENANHWRDHVMVVAHRGGGVADGRGRFPENSSAAVEHAVSVGAEMVEIDLQRTRDGVLVVLHDQRLDRTTTCRGPVAEKTFAALAACRLVVEGGGRVTLETVPSLKAMLEHTRGRILANVDNKLGLDDLPAIAAVVRAAGADGEVFVKQNLWSAGKVAEMRRVAERMGEGVRFMPIMADDAVRDIAFLEQVTREFAPDAVEMINWRREGMGIAEEGGILFGARARAVAARGDWHLWVNTIVIGGKPTGFLAGGRGDELAVHAGMPAETYGFWAEQGATMIQTDAPSQAIEWLEKNGYRVPYGLTN